eukprot:m.278625 g.278625  ORF g.278625 m.278625 type:complete len:226 (+) comp54889_c0_seq10:1366-2043(+)
MSSSFTLTRSWRLVTWPSTLRSCCMQHTAFDRGANELKEDQAFDRGANELKEDQAFLPCLSALTFPSGVWPPCRSAPLAPNRSQQGPDRKDSHANCSATERRLVKSHGPFVRLAAHTHACPCRRSRVACNMAFCVVRVEAHGCTLLNLQLPPQVPDHGGLLLLRQHSPNLRICYTLFVLLVLRPAFLLRGLEACDGLLVLLGLRLKLSIQCSMLGLELCQFRLQC